MAVGWPSSSRLPPFGPGASPWARATGLQDHPSPVIVKEEGASDWPFCGPRSLKSGKVGVLLPGGGGREPHSIASLLSINGPHISFPIPISRGGPIPREREDVPV